MMKHALKLRQATPGPWTIDYDYGDGIAAIRGPGHIEEDDIVCVVGPVDEWKANAHLISAAPDSLEACKALLYSINRVARFTTREDYEQAVEACKLANAAVAKAEGRQGTQMIRNWQEVVEAISPGHSRYLSSSQCVEGWLMAAMRLERCPRLTKRGIYRDDSCTEILAFPFTSQELTKFLKENTKHGSDESPSSFPPAHE